MSVSRLEKSAVCDSSRWDSEDHCIALYSWRFAPGKLGTLNLCPKHLREQLNSVRAQAGAKVAVAQQAVRGAEIEVHNADRALLVFSELEAERWNNNNDNERNTP